MDDFEVKITTVELSNLDFEIIIKQAFESKELQQLRLSEFYKEIEERNKGLKE